MSRSRAFALCTAAGLALASGCATRSGDVAPLAADPAEFASWSCDALYDEDDRVRLRAARVAYSVDERAGNNIVALGLGVTVFWPALIAMRPNGVDAEELARLKGRDDTLQRVLADKRCPPVPTALSAERAAALPVAVGEGLVYEERAAGSMREVVLRVVALRRDGIEFVAQERGRPQPIAWTQDRFGNPDGLAPRQGWLSWQRLLGPELQLGDVLSGDVYGGESGAHGRLRGQVVALGVKTTLGRPFDAAVIELFGDVPQDNHSTRLTGAMVVDRKSGVLLRLELSSGNPEFALRRELVRIEPVPAPR